MNSDKPISERTQDLTRLLEAANQGDSSATDQIFSLVYNELRRIAASKMRLEPECNTLQPTSLVNEVWLKLVGNNERIRFETRGHFFVAASQAMRQILVDSARARRTAKRGGGRSVSSFQDFHGLQLPRDDQLLDLDDALSKFESLFPEKAKLVKLRYFSGMTNSQVAEHLDISSATAERWWAFARAWLKKSLKDND